MTAAACMATEGNFASNHNQCPASAPHPPYPHFPTPSQAPAPGPAPSSPRLACSTTQNVTMAYTGVMAALFSVSASHARGQPKEASMMSRPVASWKPAASWSVV